MTPTGEDMRFLHNMPEAELIEWLTIFRRLGRTEMVTFLSNERERRLRAEKAA